MSKQMKRHISFQFWTALSIVNFRESLDSQIYKAQDKAQIVRHVEDDLKRGHILPYIQVIKTFGKDTSYETEASVLISMISACCGKEVVRHEICKIS